MMQNTLPKKKHSLTPIIIAILFIIIIIIGIFSYFSKTKQASDESEAESSAALPIQVNTNTDVIIPVEIANILTRSLTSEPTTPFIIPPADNQTTQSIQSDMTISDGPLILLPEKNTVLTFTVEKGDSLSTLFNKAGLSNAVMYKALESTPQDQQSKFTRLNLGQSFEFTLNDAGDLLSLSTKPDILNTYTLAKQDNTYVFSHNAIKPTYKKVYAYGAIKSSLFAAADKAGIPHAMIMEIANAFGYDIDFALDLRQGDEFEVIFEQKIVDGKVVGTGNLLAARFTNRGKEFTVVRYTNNKKLAAYYRADGTSMQRAFIRTPVDFTRISSKFSLGRYHPVLNRIRAHKGVDYAAPTGTAIRAAGNGKIVSIGWKGGYGNAIVIQHGKTYSTLYGHMSKFAPGLKAGSYVKQSQTIGYVGMTGLATGPHLHYEFRVNGQHVDPLSVKLPMADPLSSKEKERFLKISQPLVAELNENKTITLAKIQAEKDSASDKVDENTESSEEE